MPFKPKAQQGKLQALAKEAPIKKVAKPPKSPASFGGIPGASAGHVGMPTKEFGVKGFRKGGK